VNKVVGYVVVAVGLILLALGTAPINSALVGSIPAIGKIAGLYYLVIGLVVVVVGMVFLRGAGGGRKLKEVPIFEGKGKKRKVVGYQRQR